MASDAYLGPDYQYPSQVHGELVQWQSPSILPQDIYLIHTGGASALVSSRNSSHSVARMPCQNAQFVPKDADIPVPSNTTQSGTSIAESSLITDANSSLSWASYLPVHWQDASKCDLRGSKSGKGFEATFEVLPRPKKIYFDSGVIDEHLYLDRPCERILPSAFVMLLFGKAVQESIYKDFHAVHEGQLPVIFTKELKIISWEFCVQRHEEFVPRRLVAAQLIAPEKQMDAKKQMSSQFQNLVPIFLKNLVGKSEVCVVDLESTVRNFKEQRGISNSFRLLYGASQLEDSYTLSSYGIGKDATLILSLRLRGGHLLQRILPAVATTFSSRFFSPSEAESPHKEFVGRLQQAKLPSYCNWRDSYKVPIRDQSIFPQCAYYATCTLLEFGALQRYKRKLGDVDLDYFVHRLRRPSFITTCSALCNEVREVGLPLLGDKRFLLKECITISPVTDEIEICKYVLQTPLLFTIMAGEKFAKYKRGIFWGEDFDLKKGETSGTPHCVVCIGYGVEYGVPFWIVQNSYGRKWGQKGICKIVMGYGVITRVVVPIFHEKEEDAFLKLED